MTKRTYFLLLLAVAVGLFSWLYVRKSILFTGTVLQSPRPVRVVPTSPSSRLSGGSTVSTETTVPARNQNLNLQIQLADERDRLTALQQNLEDLRTRRLQLQQQASANSNLRMAQTQDQIQTLTDSLQDRPLAEDAINHGATAALRAQRSAARLAREQLDESIRQQQEIMQATQNQLYQVSQNRIASLDEKQARMTELQNALNLQNQNLQNLRDQRVQVSSNILLQTRSIGSETQAQRDNLAQNTDATRQQIQNLREEVLRMKATQAEAQSSLQDLDSQIQQAQELVKAQGAQVQNLEAQLKGENSATP